MTSKQFSDAKLAEVHGYSSGHRDHIEHSFQCGCFHCEQVFGPQTIKTWIDDGQTAVCPHCGIDSVIPGGPLFISAELLSAMSERYFSEAIASDRTSR